MVAQVTAAEGAWAAAAGPEKARLELVAPFVEAAAHVIRQECGEMVGKGEIFRVRSPQTSNDVSTLIAVTGGLAGLVIYSMTMDTALGLSSRMIGEEVIEFDALAQSAVAELANMITGQAGIALERTGYPSDMSPPVLLIGHGSSIATFNLTRLVIPLVMSFGEISIDISVKEA